MFPFVQNVWNREVCRDRLQINGCQGLGIGRNGERLFNGYEVSFWDDEKGLDKDISDGCTTL